MTAVSTAVKPEAPRGFWRRQHTDIITPLVLLDVAMIAAMKYGRAAMNLDLPTAEFSVWAPAWMLIPIFVSFFIRSRRWAMWVWRAAMAGMFYAPLLFYAGSTTLDLPHPLSAAAKAEFQKRFSAPVLFESSAPGRRSVRIRRRDIYAAVRASVETTAAVPPTPPEKE